MRLVVGRRSPAEDGLEFDRQQMIIREPRLLVSEPLVGDQDQLSRFTTADDTVGGRHLLAVWMTRAAAQRQWSGPLVDTLPDAFMALGIATGPAKEAPTTEAAEAAIFAVAPSMTTPTQLQQAVGDGLPLVALTTHTSLLNPTLHRLLTASVPVFVVMDLPVAWHVRYWIEQNLTVRFAITPLTGSPSGDLWLAAFALDHPAGFVFLSFGSGASVSLLAERLRTEHPDELLIDPDVLRAHRAGIDLAIGHVFTLWSRLDQIGTARGADVDDV